MKIKVSKDEARILRTALKIWRDSCRCGPSYDQYPGEMGNKKWQRAYKDSQRDLKIILDMLKDLKGK